MGGTAHHNFQLACMVGHQSALSLRSMACLSCPSRAPRKTKMTAVNTGACARESKATGMGMLVMGVLVMGVLIVVVLVMTILVMGVLVMIVLALVLVEAKLLPCGSLV